MQQNTEHPNEKLIRDFYEAFESGNADAMTGCYHDDIHFSDPVFQDLKGGSAKAMWHMLISRSKELRIEFSDIAANDETGSARWQAWYTFSKTGNRVHNIIEARFTFKDGKIIEHKDSFSLHRWSSQALGLSGLLFGWFFLFQNQIREEAKKGLQLYMKRNRLSE